MDVQGPSLRGQPLIREQEIGGPDSVSQVSDGNREQEVLRIPSIAVGHVFGGGRKDIERIQKKTRATIWVDDDGRVTFMGKGDAISLARAMIVRRVRFIVPLFTGTDEDRPEDWVEQEKYVVRFSVPAGLRGLLIGKGGETVCDVTDRTGTHISIGDDEVVISGEEGAVKEAQALIVAIVQTRYPHFDPDGTPGEQEQANMCKETIKLLKTKIPLLIGGDGNTIRNMIRHTGASIEVEGDDTIIITGSVEEVRLAKDAISWVCDGYQEGQYLRVQVEEVISDTLWLTMPGGLIESLGIGSLGEIDPEVVKKDDWLLLKVAAMREEEFPIFELCERVEVVTD